MREYRRILLLPNAGALLAASLIARLPTGMNGIAIVLYIQSKTGAFGLAGLTAGAASVGFALGSLLQARLIDSYGQRVLAGAASGHAVALGALLFVVDAHAPGALVVACGLAAGVTLPSVSPVLRGMYRALLRSEPGLQTAAFALDAALADATFVLGPLIVAVVVVASSPGLALVVSLLAGIVGTLAFVRIAERFSAPGSAPSPRRAGWRSWGSPGIWTLSAGSLGVGFAYGTLEVALPAFAADHSEPGWAAVLLALVSVGSIGGSLAYGAGEWLAPVATRHLYLGVALPFAVFAIAMGSSVDAMALLVLPTGLVAGPLIACRNELAGDLAITGRETEAFTLTFTSLFAGLSAGAAVAGPVVDALSWRSAVILATTAAALAAWAVVAFRAWTRP